MACFSKAATLTFGARFWAAVWTERTRAAYLLHVRRRVRGGGRQLRPGPARGLGAGALRFPGKRLIDSLVDLPFALPTAVGGLVYSSLYVENGWLGRYLVPLGIQGAYTPLRPSSWCWCSSGLPFVVRTVQPVLEDLDPEAEEAAASLGATPLADFPRVILPPL